jgi:S-adenosylmethionine hydrolase
VVDPGVGSQRRGLIVETGSYLFVAPDNGVLSLVFPRDPVRRIVSIEAEHYFRQPVSATFHGRDVFGPVAGLLAKGLEVTAFGPEIQQIARLDLPLAEKKGDSRLRGVVLHIDRFGNVITSLGPEHLSADFGSRARPVSFRVKNQVVSSHVRYYSEGPPEGLFSLLGSSGYYELAAWKQSAAAILDVEAGIPVEMEVSCDEADLNQLKRSDVL